MGLRPFPYQLGIGTDIVHVNRIRAILQRDRSKPGYLDRFLRRLLTPRERIEFYKTRDNPAEAQLDVSSKHLAGRWAAKEAVIKAVSWRRLSFHDIVIQRGTKGGSVLAVILDKTSNTRRAMDPIANTSSQATNVTKQIDDAQYSWMNRAALQESPMENNLARLDDTTKLAEQNFSDRAISSFEMRSDWIADPSAAPDAAGQIAKLSISHDGEYATAVCLAAEPPLEGSTGGETAAGEVTQSS